MGATYASVAAIAAAGSDSSSRPSPTHPTRSSCPSPIPSSDPEEIG